MKSKKSGGSGFLKIHKENQNAGDLSYRHFVESSSINNFGIHIRNFCAPNSNQDIIFMKYSQETL
jgi:hypothetical protein